VGIINDADQPVLISDSMETTALASRVLIVSSLLHICCIAKICIQIFLKLTLGVFHAYALLFVKKGFVKRLMNHI